MMPIGWVRSLWGFVLITMVAVGYFSVQANASDSGEISALEMQKYCRGVEQAKELGGGKIYINTTKFPNALICYGAFSTFHQESLRFYHPEEPAFLPGVCSIRDGHGQSFSVLIRVFTHYVDNHPQDSGKDFLEVAWEAFKAAWLCKR